MIIHKMLIHIYVREQEKSFAWNYKKRDSQGEKGSHHQTKKKLTKHSNNCVLVHKETTLSINKQA